MDQRLKALLYLRNLGNFMILCKWWMRIHFYKGIFIFFCFFKSTQNQRKIPFLLPLFFLGVFKFSPGFFRCVFPYFESRTRCRPKFGPLARGCSSYLRCLLGGHLNRFRQQKTTVKPPRFWRNKDLLNVVCMKFMSSDVNQNVLTHQFIWIAITYQSMWIISYESISNDITQSISIPIRVTLPSPKNCPFFLQHRQELLHLKDHVVVTEAASEGTGGGSIWSTSKHGRETYRDPIFAEKERCRHGNLGEHICFGLKKSETVVSEFCNKKTFFFINTSYFHCTVYVT